MGTQSTTYCDACGKVLATGHERRSKVGRAFVDISSKDHQKVKRDRWEDLCPGCYQKAVKALRRVLGDGIEERF